MLLRLLGMFGISLGILFVASCQNIVKNECYFEPIYLSSQDILVISDELAETIFIHNEIWRANCN